MTPSTAAARNVAAPTPSAATRERWLRRYGLAATGAAIVVAWILIALFAAWLAPIRSNKWMWSSGCCRARPCIGWAPTFWVAALPGFTIRSVVIGFNFLGDGVRDWLDPKSRRR